MALLKKELKPFQKAGAEALARNYHYLLADEPGLGKTIQALAACAFHKFKRVAITCPASVRSGWRQEIEECGLPLSNFHIDSYEAATAKKFPAGPYDAIIMDEAHYLKNMEAERCRAVLSSKEGLAYNCKFKWPMTGTPFLNRPREIFPVMRQLQAEKMVAAGYDSYDKFTADFCAAHWNGYEVDTRGASNLEKLKGMLNGFMLRRTVDEVMPELPPILLSQSPIELTDEEKAPIYNIENEILDREAFLSTVRENYSQLGDTSRLRKATGVAMAKKAADFIEDRIMCGAGKVVVFFHHREVGRILEQELGHRFPVFYAGGMTDNQKDKARKAFMTDDNCEVFLGQMKASGTGINGLQTVSHTAVIVEPDWSPEETRQILARLRRMGMDLGRPVNAYILHVPGTIQSAVVAVNVAKERVIERLVPVSSPKIITPSEFEEAEITTLLGDL